MEILATKMNCDDRVDEVSIAGNIATEAVGKVETQHPDSIKRNTAVKRGWRLLLVFVNVDKNPERTPRGSPSTRKTQSIRCAC